MHTQKKFVGVAIKFQFIASSIPQSSQSGMATTSTRQSFIEFSILLSIIPYSENKILWKLSYEIMLLFLRRVYLEVKISQIVPIVGGVEFIVIVLLRVG